MARERQGRMKWTVQRANEWQAARSWQCGFNYLPGSAVNSTEMWQAETFDPQTIARELGWAQALGLNACRVFLQYLVWEADPDALLQRLDAFLAIAQNCGISVMPILFDDCAFGGQEPYLGPQRPPVPGVHNSGWTASPGFRRVIDAGAWAGLEKYVAAVVGRFGQDERISVWDVYNEPGNAVYEAHQAEKSLPLLREAFGWTRRARPAQPVTGGVWTPAMPELNAYLLENSDVITFHEYRDLDTTREFVAELRRTGRPLLCTEWMRRNVPNRFDTHLAYFKQEHIGCYFWGLVNGKTQTHIPWESKPGSPEPETWFHDLLRPDGAPYDPAEIALIREIIGRGTP